LDQRSDIYSLGATLFHMLAGRPPFISRNFMGVLTSHLTKPFPDPRSFNSKINADTAALVLRMCRLRRSERFPNMEAVVAEIGRLLGLPSASDAMVLLPDLAKVTLEDGPQVASEPIAANLRLSLGCPRCQKPHHGDPRLVSEGQLLYCKGCGLVYVSPHAGGSSSSGYVSVRPILDGMEPAKTHTAISARAPVEQEPARPAVAPVVAGLHAVKHALCMLAGTAWQRLRRTGFTFPKQGFLRAARGLVGLLLVIAIILATAWIGYRIISGGLDVLFPK
jgi:hypothetical protein